MSINDTGMGAYIHIPFCVSKCAYCDFLSFERADTGLKEKYVQALIAEMRCFVADFRANLFDTVYIGGGTPTALPPSLLCEILREIKQFNLSPGVEITLEMNPSTNQHAVLADYASHGINRLSIGLQAWQDEFLRGLRRSHTATEFTETMNAALAAGIGNINVDLMFGLPWQSMWHWRESITQVIAHAPTHISAYSLTPAENTPLWDALEAGALNLPCESVDRAMYHEAIRMFTAAGYQHYELSNFAKPGRESRHNIDCWLRKPYVGFGLGAHSFDGKKRWRNTMDMGQYLRTWGLPAKETLQNSDFDTNGKTGNVTFPLCAREDVEVLSKRDAMAEAMFLGLRMTKGVCMETFFHNFGEHIAEYYGHELKMLTAKGLITCTPDRVMLTSLGLDLANQVFEAFV